ncbi:uncharacterized protein LOC144124025 [Amblyomma americanum]
MMATAADGGQTAVARWSMDPAEENVAATPGREKRSNAVKTQECFSDAKGQPLAAGKRNQATENTDTQTMVTALSVIAAPSPQPANRPPDSAKQKKRKQISPWGGAEERSVIDYAWMHFAGVYLVVIVFLGSIMVAYMLRQRGFRPTENLTAGDFPTTPLQSSHGEDKPTRGGPASGTDKDDGWSAMQPRQGVESQGVGSTAEFFPSGPDIVNSANNSQMP